MLKCLAPLENFADTVFRQVLCAVGKPDLMFTEFMNVDVFCTVGREAIIRRVESVEAEKPLILQLWGNVPENYITTIEYLFENGYEFDGIDINFGCSVPKILRVNSGAGMIRTPSLAKEIIDAVKSSSKSVPVSVKTRLGFDEVITEDWCGLLLQQDLSMLSIHGRTAKQKYKIPADWNEIQKVVQMRDEMAPHTKIIGNGDIRSTADGETRSLAAGADGYMIGRAITDHPWFFTGMTKEEVPRLDRIEALLLHLEIYEKKLLDDKPFHTQHKFARVYLNTFPDARRVRRELANCDGISAWKVKLEEAKHWK